MSATPKIGATPSITYDSHLIEDYLHVTEVLVDTTKENPLAVIVNNAGQSEALAVHTDGQLYHVCREPLSDSGWNMIGIGAGMADIANANAGTFWGVGTDDALWRNDGGRWAQVVQSMPTGTPVNGISLGVDGILYASTSDANFPVWWSSDGGKQWNALLSWLSPYTLPVGSSDNLWATDFENNMYRYTSGTWNQIASPDSAVAQIAVGFDNSVFILGANNVWQYIGDEWQQVCPNDGFTQIAVVTAGNLWAVASTDSNTYVVQQYVDGQWQLVESPLSADAAEDSPGISVGVDGSVCCIDSFGMVFKYLGAGAGWQKLMLPTGIAGFTAKLEVDEFAANQDAQGVQHAFFIAAGHLYHARLQTYGGWSFDNLNLSCSGIGATYQHDTKELIVYGVGPSGGLMVVRNDGSGWSGTEWPATPPLEDVTIQLNAINEDSWYTFALMSGGLYTAWGSASNPLGASSDTNNQGQLWPLVATPNTPSTPSISRLAKLPMYGLGTVYVAVVDTSGNLYLVSNIFIENALPYYYNAFGYFERLSGTGATPLGSVTSTAGALGPDGKLRIYATDANDKLWILREASGGNLNSTSPYFTWGAWHPLGDGALYLANGPGSLSTADLYTLDADSFLVYLSQNAVTNQWTSLTIKKPVSASDTPDYISQYVTQVTVLDSNGSPTPDAAVTVTTEEPVAVWVDGIQYTVDSDNPLTLTTSGLGTITLNTPALGLHTAQLTFAVDGATAQPVYPPQHAHDRLAGVDAPTLSNAQSQTRAVPLPAVTQPLTSNTGADFSGAAKAMNDVFKVPLSKGVKPGKAICRVADARTASALLSRASRSAAADAAGRRVSDPGDWDDFWNDLANYAEDVYHGIRTGAMQVVSVDVDIGNKLMNLGIYIEGIGESVLQFSITTLQDVGNALHSFFAYIAAEVEAALDWLKELFEWQDIVNTKTVIEYYLNQALTNIAQDLDPNSSNNVQAIVDQYFADLISGVTSAFESAKSTFAQSFNQLAGGAQEKAIARGVRLALGNPLQPTQMTGAYQSNKVRVDYVQSKSYTYSQPGGTMNASVRAKADPPDLFQTLCTKIENTIGDTSFQQALQSMSSALQAALTNPQTFFDMGIYAFLSLAEDFCKLVLTLLEEIITTALDLVGDAISGLQDFLNTPINIPAISYIYQQISQHPFTLLDLASLFLAMPATILYKATSGGPNLNPPFTTDPNRTDIMQVSAVINTPILWPQIPNGNAAQIMRPRPAVPGNPMTLEILLGILYCTVTSVCVTATDIWSDTAANKATQTPSFWVTLFSSLNIIAGVVGQAFCVPYQVIAKPVESRSKADWLYLSNWAAGFLPIALNLVFTIFGDKKAMMKFVDKYGTGITCATGAALVGLGTYTASVENDDPDNAYNVFYQAQAMISPVPQVMKWLVPIKSNIALGILLGFDSVCDVANGGLGWAEATS